MKKLIIFAFLFLFLFSYVSAVRVDYSPNDKGIKDMKAVVKDTILFGLISVGEQGTMELKSHNTIYEKRGVEINTLTEEVNPAGIGLIYETNFGNEHKDALTDVKIIDMRTGKEVERDWRFVYSGDGQWEIPIYKEVCSKEEQLKEEYERNCDWVFDYYKYEPRKVWNVYDNNNIPKGKFELGIEIEVKKGDYLDIVLEVQGKSIDKHAQVIEGIAGYIYAGGAGNQSVVKYDKDFNIVAVSPSYGEDIRSISLDNDYVYYGGAGNQSVVKYDKDFNIVAVSPNYGGIIFSISLDDDYVYYGGSSTRTVRKAYKTNLTTINDSPNYGGNIYPISLDDDYVYYGGQTTQTVRKAYKTNLTTITDSPNYGGIIFSISLDDDYVYYGGSSTRTVRKAYKTNLTTINDSPNYGGDIRSISLDNDYVYYGGAGNQSVVKYDKDFNIVAVSPSYGGTIYPISLDDDYVYYGGQTTQTVRKAYKTNLTTITDSPNYGGIIFSISLEASSGLEISLTSPINYYNSSSSTIDFSANLTDEGNLGIQNVSLVINDTIYDANTSGLTGVYNFSETLSDGFYEWYIEAYDDTDELYESETRYFTIDTLAPSIEILSPVTSYNYLQPNQTIDLNVTVTDASDHLDSCWYEYNSSIIYFNCSENQTFNYIQDQNTLTVYANDTFGNEGSENVSWDYKILEINQTYNNETIIGSSEDFELNIKIGDGYSLTSAKFIYLDQEVTASIFGSGNERKIQANNFQIPLLFNNTNASFYWELVVSGTTINIENRTQSVSTIFLDNCSVNTYPIFNISLFDERLRTPLNGTIELNYYILNKFDFSLMSNLSFSANNTQNTRVCSNINLTEEGIYYSSEIRYYAPNYATEFYHIQRALLTEEKILNLYDLHENESTMFKITYQDSTYTFVEDAIIQLKRKYISDDIYEVVEAPLTSSEGTAIVHIDLDTNKYDVIIVKNGVVLDTFENLAFVCDSLFTGECNQKLLGKIDPINDINIDTKRDFTYTDPEVINDTIKVTYSIPSSSPSLVELILIQQDQFGNSTLCNKSITSSAGSLECNFSKTIGESYIELAIRKDGELISKQSYIMPEEDKMDFLGNNYIIVMLLLLSIIGMAFTSPEWIILNGVITFFIAGSLWLLSGLNFVMGIGNLIWLLLASGILIFKLAKQEDR